MANATGEKKLTPQVNDWARTLIAVFVNQLIILGHGAIFTIGLVSESHRATDAMEFVVPPATRFYFDLGPVGILGITFVSVLISAACLAFRKRGLSVVMISCSFISAATFLGIGVFYAVAPLYAALRMLLPSDATW